jgi:hypothetical protein
MIKLASSTALAVLLLSAPAFAQTAPAPADTAPMATPATPMTTPAAPNAAPVPGTSGMVDYVPAQTEGQWLASNFIGETVRGTNDENIGEINDILVDKGGNVVAAVIGVGGFLGIGEKDVAVPFSALQISNERDQVITIAATKDQLKAAPAFRDLDDQDDARTANTNNTAAPVGGMPPATTPARPAPAAPAQ